MSRDLWLLRPSLVRAQWVSYDKILLQNWERAFPATRDKMFMKCPRKYGRIYDHKGAMSTTNGHLPRALPVTKQQRHLPSASMEIRTSLVDQTVSVCLQCGRSGFDPWVGKILWRRKWHPTPVLLPGKSHGWRSPVNYSPGVVRVGHDWVISFHFYENWTLCCYSCWPSTIPEGIQGGVRHSMLQGIWWDRSSDSLMFLGTEFMISILASPHI